jgi:SAM-dependent methyltransferase
MRRFIREKASRESITNLFVMDGFLDSIPLPPGSVDVLMTSNAIGWNPEGELKEIERVLKSGAHAIHLMISDSQTENPLHGLLVSSPWNYSCAELALEGGLKLMYFKTFE